jgi:hypothetical protein
LAISIDSFCLSADLLCFCSRDLVGERCALLPNASQSDGIVGDLRFKKSEPRFLQLDHGLTGLLCFVFCARGNIASKSRGVSLHYIGSSSRFLNLSVQLAQSYQLILQCLTLLLAHTSQADNGLHATKAEIKTLDKSTIRSRFSLPRRSCGGNHLLDQLVRQPRSCCGDLPLQLSGCHKDALKRI